MVSSFPKNFAKLCFLNLYGLEGLILKMAGTVIMEAKQGKTVLAMIIKFREKL